MTDFSTLRTSRERNRVPYVEATFGNDELARAGVAFATTFVRIFSARVAAEFNREFVLSIEEVRKRSERLPLLLMAFDFGGEGESKTRATGRVLGSP